MTDLRVNTRAIKDSYLHPNEPLTVNPVFTGKAVGARPQTYDSLDAGAKRIVDIVKRFVEARLMGEHRELVNFLDQDLLWDGPPIMLSNKGHVRVAKYLSTFFAQAELHPSLITVTPKGADRTLLEFDALLVNHPTRVWYIPATLLLPRSVKYQVHFKVGVHGPLEAGKIEMVIGRITNLPAMFPQFVRQYFGILFGALPHMFEGAWGYLVDFTGDDYYKIKREQMFRHRHPNSQNPLVDTAVDMVQDTIGWAKDNAWTAADTAWTLSEGVINTATSYAQWVYNTAMNIIEGGVQTASATAGKVAGTAAGAADVVVDYGKATANAAYGTAANVANQTYATTVDVSNSAYEKAMGAAANVAGTVKDSAATAEAKADTERRKGITAAPAGFDTRVAYTAPTVRAQ